MSLDTLLQAAHFVDTDNEEDGNPASSDRSRSRRVQGKGKRHSATNFDVQIGLGEGSSVVVEQNSGEIRLESPARSGGTPKRASRVVGIYDRAGVTREVHNRLEKNRRAQLRLYFESLQQQLPGLVDRKTSSLAILKGALDCIEQLKRKDREYELEANQLRRQKRMKQEQLRSLRSELGQDVANAILAQAERAVTSEVTLEEEEVLPAAAAAALVTSYVETQPVYVTSNVTLPGTRWHSHIMPSSSSSSDVAASATAPVVTATASAATEPVVTLTPPIRIELQ
eukprot:m.24443 g.24443  ORF g.24443 m.24443 type:complete len:283 (+) comp28620_c0_seq1:384-1232(+)